MLGERAHCMLHNLGLAFAFGFSSASFAGVLVQVLRAGVGKRAASIFASLATLEV